LIGGKWKGGKVFGFVFATDPTELLDQIANGEKRNLKKEFQFFATPEKLADELVYLADLETTGYNFRAECWTRYNGLGLGEVGEIEAQMFNKPQMLIEVRMFKFSTSAPILPNPC
jgi:hypothetical protein